MSLKRYNHPRDTTTSHEGKKAVKLASEAHQAEDAKTHERFGSHTLMLAPPNITQVYDNKYIKASVVQGRQRQDVKLGIDTCVVCGTAPKNMIKCPHCQKVLYCSPEHRKYDRNVHHQVCEYLHMIAEDETFVAQFPNVNEFIWTQLRHDFIPNAEETTDQQVPLIAQRVQVELPTSRWNWEMLLFEPLRRRFPDKVRETMEIYTSHPRIVLDDEGNCVEVMTQAASSGAEDTTKPASDDSSKVFYFGNWNALVAERKSPGEEWQLPPSALVTRSCLRFTTAALTNPMTIAHVIATNAALSAQVRRQLIPEEGSTNQFDRTLTIHVIGASEHECDPSRLPFWSALPIALSKQLNLTLASCGEKPSWYIQILFVGLEMPRALFEHELPDLELSPHLRFAFCEGSYDLCVETLDSVTSARVGMSPPPTIPTPPPNTASKGGKLGTGTTGSRQTPTNDNATSKQSPRFAFYGKDHGFSLSWGYPTLMCGFQMGLTVPEYSWKRALTAMDRMAHSSRWTRYSKLADNQEIKESTASEGHLTQLSSMPSGSIQHQERQIFLLTTSSSEEEAVLESQKLSAGHRFSAIFIAKPNPVRSLQPLQSGTLGNDVWSKNVARSLYQLSTLY